MHDLYLDSKNHNDENLVVFYIKSWHRYVIGCKFLNNIFAYINRYWVKREREEGHRNIHDIYTLCLNHWREDLFIPMHSRLIAAVLELINKQRDGESIETQNIKYIVQSCVALGLDENNTKRTNLVIYTKYFEDPFIDDTASYYTKESAEFLQSKGVVEYLKKASARLKEEAGRVDMYLHPRSEENLRKTCTQVLVANHATEIQEQFLPLLKGDRESDLNLTFTLLEAVKNGLTPLMNTLNEYVKEQGLGAIDKLLTESEGSSSSGVVDNQAYVDTLLAIHSKYTRLVQVAFNNHSNMRKSLDDACRSYINNNSVTKKSGKGRATKTPELLARYSDSLLKKSSKNAEVSDIDAALNNVMVIFQYVDEKDAFEKSYSRNLARRLVHGTSLSQDAETNMITKLKEICGSEYTNKLQRMFQDMETSSDMTKTFREYLETSEIKPSGEFTAYILAEGYWPLPPFSSNFKLPSDMDAIKNKFVTYYTGKHNGRKLQWLWNFGKGEIKANFSKQSKTGFTFQVSIFQMAILLPYNNALEYSIEQLRDITLLDDEPLKGSLSILLKAKVLIMSGGASGGKGLGSSGSGVSGPGSSGSAATSATSRPGTAGSGSEAMDIDENGGGASSGAGTTASSAGTKSKGIGSFDEALVGAPGTRYRLNQDFRSKKVRVNLNMPLKTDQKREQDDTQKSLVSDRRMFLDACVVRIMKARQELSHIHLIQETIDQSSKRFVPLVSDIKKCIEGLIEREYLQRVDDKTYRYLA